MTITVSPEIEQAIQDDAARQGKTPEQLAMETLIASLRNQRVPQSLDEIRPRRSLPPGKTLKDMIDEFNKKHPSNETDEEVHRSLDALS